MVGVGMGCQWGAETSECIAAQMSDYLDWLNTTWTWPNFQEFCARSSFDSSPYEPQRLSQLGKQYASLSPTDVGVPSSLDRFWDIRIAPHIGPGYRAGTDRRFGVFAQDFPLPTLDALIAGSACPRGRECRPYHGERELPASIMADEIAHVGHGNPAYRTLRSVTKSAADVFGMPTDAFIERGIVGDVVKLFAPFSSNGRPFTGSPEKRAAHTESMYAFAASLFPREVQILKLERIVLLGMRASEPLLKALEGASPAWHVYRPANGDGVPYKPGSPWTQPPPADCTRSIIALPHPKAWGGHPKALRLALDGLGTEGGGTGGPPAPPEAPPAADPQLEPLRTWLEHNRGPLAPRVRKAYEAYGYVPNRNVVTFFPRRSDVLVVFAVPPDFPWAHGAHWAPRPFNGEPKLCVPVTQERVPDLDELLPLLDHAWPITMA